MYAKFLLPLLVTLAAGQALSSVHDMVLYSDGSCQVTEQDLGLVDLAGNYLEFGECYSIENKLSVKVDYSGALATCSLATPYVTYSVMVFENSACTGTGSSAFVTPGECVSLATGHSFKFTPKYTDEDYCIIQRFSYAYANDGVLSYMYLNTTDCSGTAVSEEDSEETSSCNVPDPPDCDADDSCCIRYAEVGMDADDCPVYEQRYQKKLVTCTDGIVQQTIIDYMDSSCSQIDEDSQLNLLFKGGKPIEFGKCYSAVVDYDTGLSISMKYVLQSPMTEDLYCTFVSKLLSGFTTAVSSDAAEYASSIAAATEVIGAVIASKIKTSAPPTHAPPTHAPPTHAPPTQAPPTHAPPTGSPPAVPDTPHDAPVDL